MVGGSGSARMVLNLIGEKTLVLMVKIKFVEKDGNQMQKGVNNILVEFELNISKDFSCFL